MIRSVDPASRNRWPELLSHIIFMYNSTPHSITGVSPYRMLYGRDPYTTIDQLLSNTQEEWTEDFVAAQAKNLKKAHSLAEQRMNAALQKQKQKHDDKPLCEDIPIGKRVLLQKCAFSARHKLEDRYNSESHVEVWLNPGDVYGIRPVMGGPTQKVNRKLLIEDPRQDTLPVLEEEPDDYPTDADNDNDVEEHPDAVPLIPHWLFGHDRPPDGPAAIRRSSRATKGKHSNPSHLPRSVIR